MRHDPERLAAAYLGQAMSRRARVRFEHHLLGCDGCWGEVAAGRRGRAAAESLRGLASPLLRDRVRAVVETVPDAAPGPPRRSRAAVAVAAAVAALALVIAGVTGTRGTGVPARNAVAAQPAPIAAVVAAYADRGAGWSRTGSAPPAETLAHLGWEGSIRAESGGQHLVVHRYADTGGRLVLVVQSDRAFPRAAAAWQEPGADWVARIDRVTVLCLTRPIVALVVGDDRAEVAAVAADLGRL